MRKIILIVVAVLVVAIGAGVAFLSSNLDSIVKKVIETAGTEVAGVKVSVGDVKISLSEGKATIAGLTVANPPGFSAPHAFKLGAIAVALDTGSLTANPIVIKDISVAAPEVTYEMGAGGGSNIDAIQKNVAAKTAGSGDKATAEKGGEKKLVIDRLVISKGTVNLATAIPGVKSSATLADIVLTGIGRKSGGASAGEVAKQVMDALTKSALKAGQSMGIGSIGDAVKGAVPGDAGGALKGVFGK
ncbi:exported protein of unknown function [Magnetospirillum gryphiswaldense MSR-1 v2]|uniref:AsmA domain-containing protein n=1 Tax=Magnetospirillum gryphiswaldense (strain DSM 6361 / JCM 21280 / NBRC 15271 / MSR-1) TaxID=431944 RepID=V6F0D5_MAGGM|nr:hypothetical protein [Magnetospirillum gryphiswaldense]CDK97756.1 exported protein of unknown function [Magnetospirillum gryphiswaldense MSR-1 v2]